jgi:hypothetical protein
MINAIYTGVQARKVKIFAAAAKIDSYTFNKTAVTNEVFAGTCKLFVICVLADKKKLFIINMKLTPDGLYFDIVVGLVGSNDPESYAGGSIATGRVTQAGQVEGDDPD